MSSLPYEDTENNWDGMVVNRSNAPRKSKWIEKENKAIDFHPKDEKSDNEDGSRAIKPTATRLNNEELNWLLNEFNQDPDQPPSFAYHPPWQPNADLNYAMWIATDNMTEDSLLELEN